MDQVKAALAAVMKHHFWVLNGLLAVVAVAVWWMATSSVAAKIDERRGALESQFKGVKTISQGGSHPNQACVDAIRQRHGMLKDSVFSTWVRLHKDQKDKNRWPQDLGDPFLNLIAYLPENQEIREDHRQTYQTFIRNHFPHLYEMIDIRLPAEFDEEGNLKLDEEGKPIKVDPFARESGRAGGGAFAPGGGGAEYAMGGAGAEYGGMQGRNRTGTQLVGIVDWNQSDLSQLRAGFVWQTLPRSVQIWLAQEDLWVYEALLRVIANTNAGASGHHNASVKQIQNLQIGQRASAAFATSGTAATMQGMGGMGGMEGMGSMDPGYGGMEDAAMAGQEYGGGGMPAAAGQASPTSPDERLRSQMLDRRYLDEKGLPLSASAEQPFAEFKMMPVRLLLLMDQRRIPRLLVNCANSSMPIEVQQVTLNPGKGPPLNLGNMAKASGVAADAGSDMYGGGMPSGGRGMIGGMGTAGEAPQYSGGATRRSGAQNNTLDVVVEILGIIYIFNPPDRQKLGTGSAGDETQPPATTGDPPATPPATPPAAPPVAPPVTSPATPPATPPVAPPVTPPATPPPAGTPAGPPAGTPATTPPAGTPAGGTATPPVAPGAAGPGTP